MPFSMPNSEQIGVGLHHVYTAVGAGAAVLCYVGLSQGNATALGQGVHQIGDGITSIAAGITTLIPVATALYAMWQSSPFKKMMAAKQNKQIAQVITVAGTPLAAIAESIPGDKITTTASVPVPASIK